jgi:hypothetical protein
LAEKEAGKKLAYKDAGVTISVKTDKNNIFKRHPQ